MGLQNSGPIKLSEVNIELGQSSNATFSMNSAASRGLAGKSSGIIKMSDYYGKSTFSYTRVAGPSLQVSTYSAPYRKMWYQYDLGTSNQPRTVVWMGTYFGGDFNTREFVDAGSTGLYSPAPTSFAKRIHYAANIADEGLWIMVLEITIPANQRFVEFYTVNTDTESCGYDYDEYVCRTNPAPSTRMYSGAGVYVMTGGLTYRHAVVSGNNTATAPATASGKSGRMVFAGAVARWQGSGAPIDPYTDRWVPSYMGMAMKYDSSPVGDTQFVANSGNTILGLVSYDIG